MLISGHDGGTGASPLTSLKHAGGPWELGLAETQQTLLLNGLRDRIVVQTDGQLKTGRDVVIAALLGAEEYGFATAPLVVSGCIMMRVCHLDTCPVGVATQNPVLRERYTGKPEFVVTFFEYVAAGGARAARRARLPHRSTRRSAGSTRSTSREAVDHWKAAGLDLTPILHEARAAGEFGQFDDQDLHCTKQQDHGLDKALDNELVRLAEPALERGEPVRAQLDDPQRQPHRRHDPRPRGHQALPGRGAARRHHRPDLHRLGRAVVRRVPAARASRCGSRATPTTTSARGSPAAGSSSGPTGRRPSTPSEQIIAGNVIGYGATAGEIFLRGQVGERFCVRNSGATAVVEGVGDHGCEYMTGGRAVVLGPDRTQLRRRHVRRLRLRARPRRGAGSTTSWSSCSRSSSSRTPARRRAARPGGPARRGDRLDGGRGAAGRLGGVAGAGSRG